MRIEIIVILIFALVTSVSPAVFTMDFIIYL